MLLSVQHPIFQVQLQFLMCKILMHTAFITIAKALFSFLTIILSRIFNILSVTNPSFHSYVCGIISVNATYLLSLPVLVYMHNSIAFFLFSLQTFISTYFVRKVWEIVGALVSVDAKTRKARRNRKGNSQEKWGATRENEKDMERKSNWRNLDTNEKVHCNCKTKIGAKNWVRQREK